MIESVLLKFYELNKRILTFEELEGVNLNGIDESPYFLVSSNEVKLNKRYFIGKLDVKTKFSFLIQAEKDLYIDNSDLNNAFDNDIVLVKITGFDYAVDKVIKSALESIICTVKVKKEKCKFYSEKDYHRFIKVVDAPKTLVSGHVVKLNVDRITTDEIICSFDKIVGHVNDPDIDILKIIYSYDFDVEFSDEVLEEVNKIKPSMDYKARKDLRNEMIITIDGLDAKDLDDAISLTYDGVYHLGVHIADVSYYVQEGMFVDESAYKRGTSVYLVDRVIPMIPHYLSNNLCSLNAHEDKLTISCQMDIDSDGKVVAFDIFPSVIKSYRRMNYTEVNNFIYDNTPLNDKKIEDLIIRMNELSLILKKVRNQRGAINFKSDELKFILNSKGKVIDVEKRETKDAEELIESFMLAANEAVAQHIHSLSYPGIYRIHEKPDIDKLEKAAETIKILGMRIDNKILNPKALQKITNESSNTKYEYIIHNTLLRAMKRAKYTNYLDVHFGLQAKYYTHFTSPIRRYPDLMVHRLLRSLIFEPTELKKKIKHFDSILESTADHSSIQERKAVDLEREVDKLKSAEYMENQIGALYSALIVKILNHGMFVRLSNGIEGFISFKDLKGYYEYDESRLLVSNTSGKTYRLGDTIKVEVLSVNMVEKQINFVVFEKGGKRESNRFKQKGKA